MTMKETPPLSKPEAREDYHLFSIKYKNKLIPQN